MGSFRIVVVFIVAVVSGGLTAMAETYKPEFSYKENRIYDGGRQIAARTGQHTFASVVLRPGGKEILEWIHMRSEKPKTFSVAEGSAPQRLILTGNLPERRDFAARVELVLTYDEKLKSYVYDLSWERRLKTRPETVSWASWKNTRNLLDPELPRQHLYAAALEYCNIGPEFDYIGPAGRCPWRYMVYQARSGEWLKVPHNHYLTLQQLYIEFKRGGALFGFFGEDTPFNPVIELVGSTADDTLVGICDAGYDYHLKIKPTQGRRRYWARFRVYCLGQDKARALLRKAKLRYTEAEMKDWQRPALRLRKGSYFTDFEQGNRQTSSDSVPIWRPYGDVSKTRWLKQGGYKSKGCMRIGQKDTPVKCHWALACNAGNWPRTGPEKSYRLTAYIKTENLHGKGAYIAADIPFVRLKKGGIRYTRGKKRYLSRILTGTNDWTKVEVEVPSLEHGSLDIWLCHDGKGVSYFDNVILESNVSK